MRSIHGHEVLDMMKGNHYSEESLLAAINQQFGNNAIFHTCSKEGMTAKELIELLTQKGKFKANQSAEFTVDTTKICQH